jgi:hypothetical protein
MSFCCGLLVLLQRQSAFVSVEELKGQNDALSEEIKNLRLAQLEKEHDVIKAGTSQDSALITAKKEIAVLKGKVAALEQKDKEV